MEIRKVAVIGAGLLGDGIAQEFATALTSFVLPDLDDAVPPPRAIAENVEKGNLGVKSGHGTYAWTPESPEEVRQRIAKALTEIQKWSAE